MVCRYRLSMLVDGYYRELPWRVLPPKYDEYFGERF
jgi:hypothetical protein